MERTVYCLLLFLHVSPFLCFAQSQGPCDFVFCIFGAVCVENEQGRPQCTCDRECPDVMAPVCGSDGTTYLSECFLDKASCEQKRRIYVASQGSCDEQDPCEDFQCSFGSQCVVENNRATCECPDVCSLIYSPVCGSDGVSYGNECEMSTAGCRQQKTINVSSQGMCVERDPCDDVTCSFGASCVVEGSVASCLCPEICLESYNPVCGSDAVDYSNECELYAAACRQQKNITVVFQGVCDIEPPTLTCPEDISSPMDCENPASTISWDFPVATDNSGLPVQLKATLPVWHGISATVTCIATDAAGNTANCSFTITFTDSANCSLEYLRTFPKNASVYIGEDHTFECSPQESSWSVSWEKDGQRLDSRATTGSNLMLMDVELEDEGLYTCIVQDCWGLTKTRADAWLYVTPKIDISKDYNPCGEAGNVLAGDDHQANEKAWPWLSRIHRNSATGSQMMCSGTLICQQWVLTTSSCFANIPDSEVIDGALVTIGEDSQAMPEEITVTVTHGEYNVSIGEGCEQAIEVDRIILHDQYDLDSLLHDYDIALLHLREPVELNSCVRTICLPSEMDTPHDPTVVGWGTASGLPENAHDVPLQYPMPLATQAKCRRISLIYDGFDVTDRMFCAGERRGTDVRCQGDNGSPLMYKRSGDEKWAVLGISTKGEKCSQYNRYGIFTRVDEEFTRWINTVTYDCFNDHIPTEIEL